jgi:AcrR family transcriptional regulator
MDQKRLTRREREQLRHRKEILDAAVSVFWEKGFNGAGVQEIAQKAEFGVGTLYRLFPGGKKEIYNSLQLIVVSTFEEELQKTMIKAQDEVQMIRAYIRAGAHTYSIHPKAMMIYLRETAWVGGSMERGLDPQPMERYRACASHVFKAITSGIKRGIFRKLDPSAAEVSLRALIISLFMRWLEEPEYMEVEDIVSFIEDVFLNGIKVA